MSDMLRCGRGELDIVLRMRAFVSGIMAGIAEFEMYAMVRCGGVNWILRLRMRAFGILECGGYCGNGGVRWRVLHVGIRVSM